MKSPLSVHHTETSEAAWSGPENEARVRAGEAESYYRRAFAWQDPDKNPETKGAWKLLHHFIGEDGEVGAASVRACQNGIAALNGSRTGVGIPEEDRAGAYAHLAAHVRDAGVEPAELKELSVALCIAEFRSLARARKEAGDDEPLVRPVLAGLDIDDVKAADKDSRELTFIISTDSIDRQGDRINQDGWDFKNFLRNPVVLWAHNSFGLPIARGLELWTERGKTFARAEFAPAEVHPFAEQVRQMYIARFMRAVSVGFLPKKWMWSEDKDRPFGIDFDKQELLEFSAVPIPAHPEALVQARSMGIRGDLIERWAKELLGIGSGPITEPTPVTSEDLQVELERRKRLLAVERYRLTA